MTDDVAVNKAAIIERCIARVREEYADDDKNLTTNLTRHTSKLENFLDFAAAILKLGDS
jgi:hypothetical protein